MIPLRGLLIHQQPRVKTVGRFSRARRALRRCWSQFNSLSRGLQRASLGQSEMPVDMGKTFAGNVFRLCREKAK